MLSTRKNLSFVKNYSIDVCKKTKDTYSIQINDLNDNRLLAELPLDPMDNMLASVIQKDFIIKLGSDAQIVLNALSQSLQENIGAKEFIILPQGCNLPDYVKAEDHPFKRKRQANRSELSANTANILSQHPDLITELDKKNIFLFGMAEIKSKINEPYQQIFDLLNGHANFTPGKMKEYKEEDINGVKARFNNKHVTTIAIKNENNLVGILRCLGMGDKFAYLSDETLNQDLLPLKNFPGDTELEQTKNRSKFLLAYFANKALPLIKEPDQFVIIAADGREDIYDSIGFKPFPIQSNNYVVTMKFGSPGPVLNEIKQKLVNSFSQAKAIENLGIRTPAEKENIATETQGQVLRKVNP